LAARAQDWPWSSARAHLAGRDDPLVQAGPMRDRVGDWTEFLASGLSAAEREAIQAGERTGRPLGSPDFVAVLEQRLGRVLARRKPGPKPRGGTEERPVTALGPSATTP
jgi:putative transposase